MIRPCSPCVGQMVVPIAGLEGLQAYRVHCYAEDTSLPPITSAVTSTPATTRCCRRLSLSPPVPPYLMPGVASPAVTLSRANATLPLSVIVSTARYNGPSSACGTPAVLASYADRYHMLTGTDRLVASTCKTDSSSSAFVILSARLQPIPEQRQPVCLPLRPPQHVRGRCLGLLRALRVRPGMQPRPLLPDGPGGVTLQPAANLLRPSHGQQRDAAGRPAAVRPPIRRCQPADHGLRRRRGPGTRSSGAS